jgi:hypothetical protein
VAAGCWFEITAGFSTPEVAVPLRSVTTMYRDPVN